MTPPKKPGELVKRRLRTLVRHLPKARDGEPDALHRVRVASRRVREALPFLGPTVAGRKLRRTRRRARRLTRALGTVRELDVALLILEEMESARPALRASIEWVRARVARERTAMREMMLGRLGELKPERLAATLASRLERREEGEAGEQWRAVLAGQLGRRAESLRAAIDHAGALYLPDRLHGVRVAVKKLRYALELADETAAARTKGLIRVLKQTQDLLGRLHDFEVLIQHVQLVRSAAPADERGVVDDLDAITADLERECRALHGRFIARRDRVIRVAETVATDTRHQVALDPQRSMAATT